MHNIFKMLFSKEYREWCKNVDVLMNDYKKGGGMDGWYEREYKWIEYKLAKMKESGVPEEEIEQYRKSEYAEMNSFEESDKRLGIR